jgi:hypothetical protein
MAAAARRLIGIALAGLVLGVAAAPAAALDLRRARACDFIGQQKGSLCLLPFPNDYYTVKDRTTATGRRVHFRAASMPENSAGKPIDPRPYNLNDGFSPGQTIMLKVSGLDSAAALRRTGAVPINHIGRYRLRNAPIVVIDVRTGRRWPIWAEIDSNPTSPAKTALEIHPAENFASGHRYVVALRDLRTAAGRTIPAPPGFRIYRDDRRSKRRIVNRRRPHFEGIFRVLRRAGIARHDLYLAWDFTVASDTNIAGRMLHIRDAAFARLGDRDLGDGVVRGSAPPFAIDPVTADPQTSGIVNFAPCGADGCQAGEDDNIARRIRGSFTVPCYLTNSCLPPARFDLNARGVPVRHGNYQANFDCIVPRTGLDASAVAAASRPSLYGHGLLGRAAEVASAPQKTLARAHGFVFCATDEIGFSNADIPNTIGILGDLGRFPELTDRVQQGFLNELYLGRLMINPAGFTSNAAFHVDGTSTASPPVIDTARLYYNGNSQGGILGGALTAVSPDFTRASLGVPAMNYHVLLPRSIDFATYEVFLKASYPDELERALALDLIQMLWDRSDPNGYAHRMTDRPFRNTPKHEVLLNVAFGDHQVTTWQADVEARTIGARAHAPVVYAGRWPRVDALFGIPRIASYPYRGSAIVYWDGGPVRPDPADPTAVLGTDPPPLENLPNRSGVDPHGLPRATAAEQQMVSEFLRPDRLSSISDTCGGGPCFDFNFAGP